VQYSGEKFYLEGVRRGEPIETCPVLELLEESAGEFGDRPAIKFRSSNRLPRAERKSQTGRCRLSARQSRTRHHHRALLGNTPDHPINFFGAWVCALPLFHIYALTLILMKRLRYGDLISLQQRFDLYEIIRYIEVKRATVLPGVPTMWIAIISLPDLDSRDLSSLV